MTSSLHGKRPIVFSLCSWGLDSVWEWGPSVSQMFRIQTDHLPFWRAPKGTGAGYGAGVADIIEWMAELVPSKWVKAYGWSVKTLLHSGPP